MIVILYVSVSLAHAASLPGFCDAPQKLRYRVVKSLVFLCFVD